MKQCHLNCKTEGPPGPIWCRECGHDPRCCNCEVTIVKLTIPAAAPPRELEDATLTHGGRLLTLVVLRQIGVKRDGEIRYRPHETVYAVERGEGWVKLVKADDRAYIVTAYGCDCKDEQVRGRERQCKHCTGCVAVGLLGGTEQKS